MKRHNAILKDENLLTLFSLNNLIVPEIQREYVWGNNPEVLEKFLIDLEGKAAPCDECHHVHTNKNVNVGFLYSYKPPYVKFESDRILDEYLIDGQQRITTLFLLLLYRAAIEGRVDDFIAIFRVETESSDTGFNYKVRDLTQRFILQLLDHVKKQGTKAFDFLEDIDNDSPSWILGDYRTDPTVKSMLSALKTIRTVFGNKENYYFDYLLINIHFWHFKTETTSQGEELYITMNSRGEQLSDNEMKKARAIPNSDLFAYGQKWEKWQTIFWRNRGKNSNADKGFNNYLASIEGLEWFMKMTERDILPPIASIETYMKALVYVTSEEFGDKVKEFYPGMYTDWFSAFKNKLWEEINEYDGVWNIIDPRGQGAKVIQDYKNKSLARNESMLFWPWMYYLKTLKADETIDDQLLIRIIHFYFIRYSCFKRSTTSISKIVDNMKETNGVIHTKDLDETGDDEDDDNTNSKIYSEEEIRISQIVCSQPDCRNRMESLIWEIQALPYFSDGKGVGGNTIIDYLNDIDIIDNSNIESSLKAFQNDIKEILKEGNAGEKNIVVKEILLFYIKDQKAFWKQQSPWYYYNYETSEWNRIVRTPHFRKFFVEYREAQKKKTATDLLSFLEIKRNQFFAQPENQSLIPPLDHRTLCILYDILTENKLWDEDHRNITFKKDPNSTKELYSGQDTLWRGMRYVDSNSQVVLPDNWRDKLKELYPMVQIVVPSASSSPSPADEK